MRRLAIAIAAVALALLMCGQASAAGGMRTEASAIGGGTAGKGERSVTTDAEARGDRSCSVLWDLSHGVYMDWSPSGRFADLVDTLSAHDILSYVTAESLQLVDLSAYDMIVIGTVLAWDSAYTAAELTAVQDFLSAGGGLLIMGENSTAPNENVNPISEAYGVTCPVEWETSANYVTSFSDHRIFDDVAELYTPGCGGLIVTPPSEAAAHSPDGDPAVSLMGDCGVIVTGDADLWRSSYLGISDNKAFALNVFTCLCNADTPAEGSSWGVIKSLYR